MIKKELKGTTLILIALVLNVVSLIMIVSNISPFTPAPSPFLTVFLFLDAALIIAMHRGFKNGVEWWGAFALIYGVIGFILNAIQGNFINITILIIIAGLMNASLEK